MIDLISFKCILITVAVCTRLSRVDIAALVHRAVPWSLAVHTADLCHWACRKIFTLIRHRSQQLSLPLPRALGDGIFSNAHLGRRNKTVCIYITLKAT